MVELFTKNHRSNFVQDAELFALKNRSRFAFRLLRSYLACGNDELDYVIKKIYCLSCPENTNVKSEKSFKKYLALLGLPLYLLLTKKWLWKAFRAVDYTFEVEDHAQFDKYYSKIYNNLTGTKRIVARVRGAIGGTESTDSISSTVCFGDILRLFVLSPLLLICFCYLSVVEDVNVVRAVLAVVLRYTLFKGYFRRYPTHNFITYVEGSNPPWRYIAFKQNSKGDLIVIQNGHRNYHPRFAYGMVDKYFVFGDVYADLLKSLNVHAKRFEPVGSLILNSYFHIIEEDRKLAFSENLYDILFIDQAFYPYNGFNKRSGEALEAILVNFHRFKQRFPKCRVAYQLRNYGSDVDLKNIVVKKAKELLMNDIVILDNNGYGESYKNISRSDLTITFESTIGYEALRLGRKVLFVNYSGDPAETMCEDERFQIEGNSDDYHTFEMKVRGLLDVRLDSLPQIGLDFHHNFDGKVQERIAGDLNHGYGK